MPSLYRALTPFYRLLDPIEDHEPEVAEFVRAFQAAVTPPPQTLLELGAGAGHNAFFLKRSFDCVLADLSPEMLELSREINPQCEHVTGDMRTLRLERTFDVVLAHDAIVYMTSRSDLEAAARTAFVHTRPGGAALFVPDCLQESFHEASDDHEGGDGSRGLRCVEWMWDPDPTDERYTVDYAFLLRDAEGVRAVHDRHEEGLFDRETWIGILSGAGFTVEVLPRPLPEDEEAGAYCAQMFLGRRPG